MPEDDCAKRNLRRTIRTYGSQIKYLAVGVALSALMSLLSSCGGGGGTGTPVQQGPGTGPPAGKLQIATQTPLFPPFDPSVTDYVFGAPTSATVQVSVTTPPFSRVSVDGQAAKSFAFTAQVAITPGQSFSVVANSATGTQTYYFRCLPADFPQWATERLSAPQADLLLFAPNLSTTSGARRDFIVVADNNGVPLWWMHGGGVPTDATLLPNGDIAWLGPNTAEEHKLDGTLVRQFASPSPIGGAVDLHELILLPDGDYLLFADVVKGPVDLRSIGGLQAATVVDDIIEEVTPSGSLVWHWSSLEHIPVTEADPLWRPQYIVNQSPAEPYHMNSVEPDGDGFIVSFRHLNAIMRIDKASGNITWKLGGAPRAESLSFSGDAYSNFGGQHDARILADGTVTLHDNGSLQGRGPRAVRYRIDTVARTATLVEQVVDPEVPGSVCCGSARKLTGGDWLMSWGLNPYITEFTPSGKRVFRMTFQNPPFYSYRAEPIAAGTLSREALRAGMDAQFPRH